MHRILIIDDERPFLRALGISLRARQYEVDLAESGEQGLQAAAAHHPDLVLLDLGLPGVDGIDVLRALRMWTEVPVVVLSARDTEDATVDALDAGADDFIAKPFGMRELMARLRAVLRRKCPLPATLAIETEHFRVDFDAKRVCTAAGEVHLTPTEWRVLELLVSREDRPLPKQQILHEVWGPHYDQETDYVRMYIAALRRKLEPEPSHPRYITTSRGLGYRFTSDAHGSASTVLRSEVDAPTCGTAAIGSTVR